MAGADGCMGGCYRSRDGETGVKPQPETPRREADSRAMQCHALRGAMRLADARSSHDISCVSNVEGETWGVGDSEGQGMNSPWLQGIVVGEETEPGAGTDAKDMIVGY